MKAAGSSARGLNPPGRHIQAIAGGPGSQESRSITYTYESKRRLRPLSIAPEESPELQIATESLTLPGARCTVERTANRSQGRCFVGDNPTAVSSEAAAKGRKSAGASDGNMTNSRSAPVSWARLTITMLLLLPFGGCRDPRPADAAKVDEQRAQPRQRPVVYSSPLQRALTCGMQPGGNLADELNKLGGYSLRSSQDAKAICEALGKLPLPRSSEDNSVSSPLYLLAALFQDVEGRDAPAFEVLYKEGLPQLMRIFDATVEKCDDDTADDLLFVLKILAMYGSSEGAQKVVEAARRPLKPDAYMWRMILNSFSTNHPCQDYVFAALSDPLPPDFLAVALLDSANAAALDGELRRHPFDTPAGCEQLRNWLEDRDPSHFSYADSAAAALPFLFSAQRDRLLALAMSHTDADVRLEAAWAAAKFERPAGLDLLVQFCLEYQHSKVAEQYLTELGREDLIPAAAQEPSFQAKAEFASWLADANEMGQPPDELEIIDHRQLAWPPDGDVKPFWLIRYRLRDRTGLEDDDVDCGLVGSVTWCAFDNMHERPPEDVYAIHCYWEMENNGWIDESDVSDVSKYADMLDQWQGDRLESPKITVTAELSPKLKAPGRLVALATATLAGQEGWVVLDGPRSTWYPQAEQPAKTSDNTVLQIHVGRQLLGFQDQPDRKKYLIAPAPPRDPQEIVAAYERLMSEAAVAPPYRQKELLGSWNSPLSRHFDEYVDALATVTGTPKPATVGDVYGRFLQLAAKADKSVDDTVHGASSVLGEHFNSYVDALVACERSAEIVGLVELFAPFWDNASGYTRLGAAALKAGQPDVAERYLLKLREGLENYYRYEEMDALAEIWIGRGETLQAHDLLLECMQKLVTDIKEGENELEREGAAKMFQQHRVTFLRLFPNGEKELQELGIPQDVL
jgi:hypothetical protein